MKNNNNILIALFVLTSLSPLTKLNAQTFIQSDLERLINNHPLMKNYDRNTGYFKDSPYDIIDINRLKEESASLTLELEEIKAKRATLTQNLIGDDSENDDLWNSSSELDNREKEINKILEKNEDYIVNGTGKPSNLELSHLMEIITEDIILPLHNENTITLNKLPKLEYEVPKINNDNLRFFYCSKDVEVLRRYLGFSYVISLMFNNSRDIILFQNSNCKSNKIAKIDFAKVLALHPKMSLFDFNRFGFYKINSLNLSQNEFEKEVISLKNSFKFDYSERNKLIEELNDLRKRIKVLNVSSKNKSSGELRKTDELKDELVKMEKELNSKIDKINYQTVNCDLTTFEETKDLLFEIEKEVITQLKDFAHEQNYEIILNTSSPNFSFSLDSIPDELKNLGDFFYLNSFYNILNDNDNDLFLEFRNNSGYLIRWLELLKNPRANERFIDEQLPIVLFGGENIETQIISNIYKKYKIDDRILHIISNVLNAD